MKKDLISIICVTKNVEDYLERCLQSIFSQTYPHIQIIIIDGASTDNTINILKKWDSKIDIWISEKDNGIYDAMNKGISRVKGEWVYFIGADDYLYPEFSTFASNELKDNHTIYYSNVMYKGTERKGGVSDYQRLKKGIYHQSIIYPAEVFKDYQYSTEYKISGDHFLNILLHSDPRYRFQYCDYTIVMFNSTGLSSELGTDPNLVKILPLLAWRHFGFWVYLRYMIRHIKYKILQKG